MRKTVSWLRAARLQFYPMTLVAYTVGALAARASGYAITPLAFGAGYACLFLMELCAVFVNDLCDYETDRINANFSPYTGGSRVLVEGRLTVRELRGGLGVAACLLACAATLLLTAVPPARGGSAVLLLAVGLALAVGYTAPPLKLAYRGLGELVVGVTHSPYMILCGYAFAGGAVTDGAPWVLSVPLFLAVFSAIVLAGIPDWRADRAVGKRTLTVLVGPVRAAIVAAAAAVLAAVSAVFAWNRILGPAPLFLLVGLVSTHLLCLDATIVAFVRGGQHDRRIDGLLRTALSYILWFGLVPLGALF